MQLVGCRAASHFLHLCLRRCIMASISNRVGPSFAAYAQQTASDKANVSAAATEVEAVETPQTNNSQANRPKTTRAGAVTNLRDLPGAHPYSLLQEGKREGKNSAQSTDARTKANDDHTDQFGDYYGFPAKAAESIAGSASKAANCHYSITLQTFACTSNNPNTPNLRKSIDPGCIHSGRGDHKNNPDSVHVKDHGPIWLGLFTMRPNTKPGHEGWYALQPVGWSKVDSFLYHMGIIRGGANLHIGNVSHGCITVHPRCQDQFNDMITLLNDGARYRDGNILKVIK